MVFVPSVVVGVVSLALAFSVTAASLKAGGASSVMKWM